MLVLSRKSQEKIRIGDSIVVTILAVKGNSVRVGIEAPRAVRIVRNELAPLADTLQRNERSESVDGAKSTATNASPSAPIPASVEMTDEAEEIVGSCSPGHLPATPNRLSHLTMPMTQFVARPR